MAMSSGACALYLKPISFIGSLERVKELNLFWPVTPFRSVLTSNILQLEGFTDELRDVRWACLQDYRSHCRSLEFRILPDPDSRGEGGKNFGNWMSNL